MKAQLYNTVTCSHIWFIKFSDISFQLFNVIGTSSLAVIPMNEQNLVALSLNGWSTRLTSTTTRDPFIFFFGKNQQLCLTPSLLLWCFFVRVVLHSLTIRYFIGLISRWRIRTSIWYTQGPIPCYDNCCNSQSLLLCFLFALFWGLQNIWKFKISANSQFGFIFFLKKT